MQPITRMICAAKKAHISLPVRIGICELKKKLMSVATISTTDSMNVTIPGAFRTISYSPKKSAPIASSIAGESELLPPALIAAGHRNGMSRWAYLWVLAVLAWRNSGRRCLLPDPRVSLTQLEMVRFFAMREGLGVCAFPGTASAGGSTGRRAARALTARSRTGAVPI